MRKLALVIKAQENFSLRAGELTPILVWRAVFGGMGGGELIG